MFGQCHELPVIIDMPAACSNASLQIANINDDFVADCCKEHDKL